MLRRTTAILVKKDLKMSIYLLSCFLSNMKYRAVYSEEPSCFPNIYDANLRI